MARRSGRQIFIVRTSISERADDDGQWHEEYDAQWRFSNARAAAAFERKAQQLVKRGRLDYAGMWPAPLYFSGSAAFTDLEDEVSD